MDARVQVKCERCAFYHPQWPGKTFGHCRRHPPTVVAADKSAWPTVDTVQWCGEFREKDDG